MAPVDSVEQTRPADDPHPCRSDHMEEIRKVTLKTRRCEQERGPITAEIMSPEVCGNSSCATSCGESDRRAGGSAEAAQRSRLTPPPTRVQTINASPTTAERGRVRGRGGVWRGKRSDTLPSCDALTFSPT